MPLDQLDSLPPEDDGHMTRMSFGDHLDELRTRLIHSLIGAALLTCVTLVYGNQIVWWITQPLIYVQRAAHLPAQTYSFGVTTPFMVYIKVSLISGVILAAPWILYQVWRFVTPGLYSNERRTVLVIVPFSTLMMVLGIMFLYYVMLPVVLSFMIFFAATYPAAPDADRPGLFSLLTRVTAMQIGIDTTPGEEPDVVVDAESPEGTIMRLPRLRQNPEKLVEGLIWLKVPEGEVRLVIAGQIRTLPLSTMSVISPLIEIGQYINFVIMLAIGILIGFQLPLVMMVIGWGGVVDPGWITRYRKHCAIGTLVISAVLTPSDPLSMLVMAIPLYGLFEFGLLLMKWARHQTNQRLAALEAEGNPLADLLEPEDAEPEDAPPAAQADAHSDAPRPSDDGDPDTKPPGGLDT